MPRIHVEPTVSPGKSAVAVRSDGKLLATAGWDGECVHLALFVLLISVLLTLLICARPRRLRLYSAKSLQPLAVLSHHRSSLQALDFAPLEPDKDGCRVDSNDDSDSEDDRGRAEGGRAKAWVAAGGQEAKVSLWEVYPPTR